MPYTDVIVERYTDSLAQLKVYYDSTWSHVDRPTLNNPYYYRLFVQPTFYFRPINQVMDLSLKSKADTLMPRYSLGSREDETLMLDSTINAFFLNLYTTAPSSIVTSQAVIDNSGRLHTDIPQVSKRGEDLSKVVRPERPIEVMEPVQVIAHKPNFWKFTQRYSLQIMQNYISDNWYKGGESNNSFLATAFFTANYNNQSKVIFENSLDIQLGFQTVKSDTVHNLRTTTDLIRMINKLGLRAAKNWYYSISLQSWTQMLPKYATNSHAAYSDFMSPFESVLSLGMEYKLSKSRFTLSANIAPLSFDLKYVDRERLETRYGNKPRHHFREYYGSNITINYTWKILNELSWTARMYYFTNYEKVQCEWENTFRFTINKYLSTNLYLYPRFDDTQKNDKGEHRLQFKEWLSLGVNFSL